MLLFPPKLMNHQWWLKINKTWKYCKSNVLGHAEHPLGSFFIVFSSLNWYDFAMQFHVTRFHVISIILRKALYSPAISSLFWKTKVMNSDKRNTSKNEWRFVTYSLLTMLSPSTSIGMQNDCFFEKCCPPNMFFYTILMKKASSPHCDCLACPMWMGVCLFVCIVIKCWLQDIFSVYSQ